MNIIAFAYKVDAAIERLTGRVRSSFAREHLRIADQIIFDHCAADSSIEETAMHVWSILKTLENGR